jgi:hypothetical protein
MVGKSSLVIELFATRHQRISVIPWIQNAVSQFLFSTRFMCFAYCHIATYHLAHVKTECKGAATPSPFSLQTAPSPHVLYICIISGWAQSFLFIPPFFPSFLMFAKRLWFFGNNVSGTRTARVFSSFKEDR